MLLELQYDFGQACLIALISIVSVFVILAIIIGAVSLMKFIRPKNKVASETLTLDQITDPDMMAAVLVASIDYRSEVKTDVKVVSVKQIK